MPSAVADHKESLMEWDTCNTRHTHEESMWNKAVAAEFYEALPDVWSQQVRKRYEPGQRAVRVFRWFHRWKSQTHQVESRFREHAERWKRETRHWSSVTNMLAHPSYHRIIALTNRFTRREVVRLLLNELQNEPDYWFAALTAITGHDPVRPEDDFDESVNAWIAWGRQEGILEENEDSHATGTTREVPETSAR